MMPPIALAAAAPLIVFAFVATSAVAQTALEPTPSVSEPAIEPTVPPASGTLRVVWEV
jgi:hypothetical protein